MLKNPSRLRAGFTAIEVVLTIGTVALAAGLSVPMYRQYIIRNDLEIARQNVSQGIQRAKFLSQVAMNDSAWGFSTDAVPGRGVLFMGENYATRDTGFDELYTIPTTISVSGITEMRFEKITGNPLETGDVVLTALNGEQRTVTVSLGDAGTVTIPEDWLTVCLDPYGAGAETVRVPDSLWMYYSEQGALMGECGSISQCGNGVVDEDEGCDDGNTISGDGCDSNCIAEVCGNSVVQSGEDCDDGGESATCDSDCTSRTCGDGTTNSTAGETCDDGGESLACNLQCTATECGNGILNVTAGEECDGGGETASCNNDCTTASCGDGVVNSTAGEQCDDAGESASCNSNCTAHTCGDGVLNATAGEQCDDGNSDNGDGCDSSCQNEIACGNGVVEGSEQCDDGNTTSGDGCDASCLNEVCGNSIVQSGESCDGGGETAMCDSDCSNVSCGDGTVNATAGEQCDDGNAVNNDGCSSTCQTESCGDGIIQTGEQCDDGNVTAGDGCDASCNTESGGGGGGGGGVTVGDGPDGDEVNPDTDSDCSLTVLKADVDALGYEMNITMAYKGNSGGWNEPFGDWNKGADGNIAGTAPLDAEDCGTFTAGNPIRVRAASWSKKKNWYDGSANNHWQKYVFVPNAGDDNNVYVLRDGDAIPSQNPLESLNTIDVSISDYLNLGTGLVELDSNQALWLIELGTGSPTSAADFQDLILLVEFDAS